MSITRTQLDQGNNTTNTSIFDTTVSISPGANSLILMMVRSHWTTAGTTSLTVTPNTGLSLTFSQFTQVGFNTAASPVDELFFAGALAGASPGSGTIHMVFGKTTSGCIWEVIQLDGVDRSGGTVASTIVQAHSGNSDTAGTTLTNIFSSNVNANNAVIGCCGQANKNGSLYTWNNSFTKDVDVGSGESTAYNLSTGHNLSGFSGTTHTVTSSASASWALLAVEVLAAAGGAAGEQPIVVKQAVGRSAYF